MPSAVTFGQTASGPMIPLRPNGYNSRVMFLKAGAVSFTFPAGATEAKIAAFGPGGGGALCHGTSGSLYAPSGGAGGGLAIKTFTGIGGLTLTGTVGAGGLGADNTGYTSGSWQTPGNNGGTTTATLAGVTISSTGGAGGAAGNNNTLSIIPAVGGLGIGGDRNFRGGSGGAATSINSSAQIGPTWILPGGGGSSASPLGDGYPGGKGLAINDSQVIYSTPAGGGGWGGQGGDAIYNSQSGGLCASLGGGTQGPGYSGTFSSSTTFTALLGGFGTDPLTQMPGSSVSTLTYGPLFIPVLRPWWDIEDIGGWGGGHVHSSIYPGMTYRHGRQLGSYAGHDATDGGGGAGSSIRAGTSAGFGGGGPGSTQDKTSPSQISINPGGVGGGGGGLFSWSGSTNAAQNIRANDGGPGGILIWWR